MRTYANGNAGERSAFTRRLDVIEKKTGIKLDREKRNGRTSEEHLKIARYIRDEINGNKNWQGRKSKQSDVVNWRKLNPDGTKYRCAKETGLDKKTVSKWWDAQKEEQAPMTDLQKRIMAYYKAINDLEKQS